MNDLGVTEQEARAAAEDARARDEETPRETALEWCRLLVGRYAGADELASLQVVDAGPCMDDNVLAEVRYQVGRYAVCRDHAVKRIRARAKLGSTSIPGPVPDEHRPDDLEQWARFVAGQYTERAVRAALRVWQLDDDTVVEIVDTYAHERAQLAARARTEELLLQQLDTLTDQRCDACRHRAETVYLAGDDALCRPCAIAALDHHAVAA